MFGETKIQSSNIGRAKSWNKRKKKITARLNPDMDSLLQHVKRSNYQTFIFGNYHDPSPPPSPNGNGWFLDENGYTTPMISSVGLIPDDMQYLHATQVIHDEGDSDGDIEDSSDEICSGSDDDMMDEF